MVLLFFCFSVSWLFLVVISNKFSFLFFVVVIFMALVVFGSSRWLMAVLVGKFTFLVVLYGLLVIYVDYWWFFEVLHGFLVIIYGCWWFLIFWFGGV